MLEWLKHVPDAVKILAGLLSFIQLLVKTAEIPGHGEEKQEAVLKGIKDTLTEHKVEDATQTVVLGLAKAVIGVYVFIQNAIGFFKHTR